MAEKLRSIFEAEINSDELHLNAGHWQKLESSLRDALEGKVRVVSLEKYDEEEAQNQENIFTPIQEVIKAIRIGTEYEGQDIFNLLRNISEQTASYRLINFMGNKQEDKETRIKTLEYVLKQLTFIEKQLNIYKKFLIWVAERAKENPSIKEAKEEKVIRAGSKEYLDVLTLDELLETFEERIVRLEDETKHLVPIQKALNQLRAQ